MYKFKLLISITIASLFILFSCSENGTQPKNTVPSNVDTTLKDIKYGTHSNQSLDLHLSAKRTSSTPTILFIHGGAWKAGNKEEMDGIIKKVRKEWPEVSMANMNYRLASTKDNIHHSEIMSDIDDCFDFLTKERNNFNINDKFYAVGASAGGHLAVIYSFKENKKFDIQAVGNFFGPSNLRDWTWYNSTNLFLGEKIGDILTNYVGASWDTTLYKALSPMHQIDSNTIPTITFHGTLDPIVPLYQSQQLRNRLTSYKVRNEYYEYVAFHGFDNTQLDHAVKNMVYFFK